LSRNTYYGGGEVTGESEKDMLLSIIGEKRKTEWTVWALDLKKIMITTDVESVLRDFAGFCWVLIDDLKKQVYLIPRGMKLCGREIRIELR